MFLKLSKSYRYYLCFFLAIHGLALFFSLKSNDSNQKIQITSKTSLQSLTLNLINKVLTPTPVKKIAKKLPLSKKVNAPQVLEKVEPIASNTYNEPFQSQWKDQYLSQLHREIENQKFYPTLAKKLGQEGVVIVGFTLTADGHLIDHKIIQPCPYHRLNQAALESVKKITHFMPIPQSYQSDKMDVKVPVEFKLL